MIEKTVKELLDRHALAIQEEAKALGIPFEGCVTALIWDVREDNLCGGISVEAMKKEDEHQILYDVNNMLYDIIERDHQRGKAH